VILLSAHCHHCASRYVQATSKSVEELLAERCIYCGAHQVVFHDHDDVDERLAA
jgi:hypothetical protein